MKKNIGIQKSKVIHLTKSMPLGKKLGGNFKLPISKFTFKTNKSKRLKLTKMKIV